MFQAVEPDICKPLVVLVVIARMAGKAETHQLSTALAPVEVVGVRRLQIDPVLTACAFGRAPRSMFDPAMFTPPARPVFAGRGKHGPLIRVEMAVSHRGMLLSGVFPGSLWLSILPPPRRAGHTLVPSLCPLCADVVGWTD